MVTGFAKLLATDKVIVAKRSINILSNMPATTTIAKGRCSDRDKEEKERYTAFLMD